MNMNEGWFEIPDVQIGARTVEEQLTGLQPALDEALNRSVIDFGCAEGLISIAFLHAGASRVWGCDNNSGFVKLARRLSRHMERIDFSVVDLRTAMMTMAPPPADIVLALAIIHKLMDPERATRWMASCARKLMVVRLPIGSEGEIRWKHGPARCDLRDVLPACGLKLEQTQPGPRGELVQYWRRT